MFHKTGSKLETLGEATCKTESRKHVELLKLFRSGSSVVLKDSQLHFEYWNFPQTKLTRSADG
jgi:hypothetical protein